MAKERIPQNVAEVLKEIGENLALFYLYSELTKDSDWGVFKNFNDVGADIVLIKERNNKQLEGVQKIKIEVKTRQGLVTVRKDKNVVHFTLSESEYRESDFVICYWVEHNYLFVVPVEELKVSKRKEENMYKFIASISKKTMNLNDSCKKYLFAWDLIRSEMR